MFRSGGHSQFRRESSVRRSKVVIACSRKGAAMRMFLVVAMGLFLTGGARAQDAQGPTDAKAHKTFQTAMDWAHEHKYGAEVDSFKKADKQDGGHCDECARKIIRYALEDGNFKDADVAAQQLIADAKDPQAQAQAHAKRAGILMKEA